MEERKMLKGKTVVLGVTGSIAAYKIANLASMLAVSYTHLILDEIATEPLAKVDYVEVVDWNTLEPVETVKEPVLVAMAVYLSLIHIYLRKRWCKGVHHSGQSNGLFGGHERAHNA